MLSEFKTWPLKALNLFSDDFAKIEKTFNVSIRKMIDIPRETHKFFIEPLSQQTHIRTIIMKRFLSFTNQLIQSPKKMPKILFDTIKYDVTSTTGSNLRNIMLLVDKTDIEDIYPSDLMNIQYHPVEESNKLKIDVAKELIDLKFGLLYLENFNQKEIKDMLNLVCTE